MNTEELDRINMFLARVNKVTCPFRHGNSVPESALVRLSNEQIEMEKWLKNNEKQEISEILYFYNMNFRFHTELKDDKVIAHVQSEIENIAIEKLGTHEHIYFEPIPLSKEFELKWYDEDKGWRLQKSS